MQKLLLLLLSSTIIYADPKNTMTYRASLYIKWIRHQLTDQEKQIIKESMPTDCAIVMVMGGAFTAGTIVLIKYAPKSIKEWQNLGKFISKQKQTDGKFIYKKMENMNPQVEEAFKELSKKDNIKSNLLSIGEEKFLLGINGDNIMISITHEQQTNGLPLLGMYPLTEEFGKCLMQQEQFKDKKMTIFIYESKKNDRLSRYGWDSGSHSFELDLKLAAKKH